METPDQRWFRLTSNARATAEARLKLLESMKYTPEKFRDLHRELVEHYDRTILGAWAEYEKTLTPGEYVVPNEVERIRAKRGLG